MCVIPPCVPYFHIVAYLALLFHSIMSDEIKSILFATKKEKKKHKRAEGGCWWYDSRRKLDSGLLKPPDELLTTARTAPQTEGGTPSCWNLLGPHLPTAGWRQGLHIKVLVAFRGEGQGFDWAVLLNGHRMSTGTARAYLLAAATACEAERRVTHTASAMNRQLQLTALQWSFHGSGGQNAWFQTLVHQVQKNKTSGHSLKWALKRKRCQHWMYCFRCFKMASHGLHDYKVSSGLMLPFTHKTCHLEMYSEEFSCQRKSDKVDVEKQSALTHYAFVCPLFCLSPFVLFPFAHGKTRLPLSQTWISSDPVLEAEEESNAHVRFQEKQTGVQTKGHFNTCDGRQGQQEAPGNYPKNRQDISHSRVHAWGGVAERGSQQVDK